MEDNRRVDFFEQDIGGSGIALVEMNKFVRN
jgi:hypothetical protein